MTYFGWSRTCPAWSAPPAGSEQRRQRPGNRALAQQDTAVRNPVNNLVELQRRPPLNRARATWLTSPALSRMPLSTDRDSCRCECDNEGTDDLVVEQCTRFLGDISCVT